MRLPRTTLVLAAIAGLTGCAASDKPEPEAALAEGAAAPAPPASTAPAPAPAPAPVEVRGVPKANAEQQAEYDAFAALGYKLAWRASPLVGKNRRTLFFDSFGDSLVFQDTGNFVTLLEAATGAPRWSTEVDAATTRFTGNALVGDRVYSASDNELFVLDAKTGNILERHHLAAVVNTPPIISGAIVVFGSPTGEVVGHSLASTYKQWGYRLRGAITSTPALVSGFNGADAAICVVSQGGEVLIADARNGSSFGHASVFAGLANNPVAAGETVYIAGTDQSIYAFDMRGGRQRWRVRTEQPISDQPVLHGDSLFVAVPGRGMLRLDTATGAVKWASKGVSGALIATRSGRLIVWDADTFTACALDMERGDVIERVTLEGVVRLVPERFEDGALYAVNAAGRVSKFGPR